MGVEFIGNPNNVEYTDDELDYPEDNSHLLYLNDDDGIDDLQEPLNGVDSDDNYESDSNDPDYVYDDRLQWMISSSDESLNEMEMRVSDVDRLEAMAPTDEDSEESNDSDDLDDPFLQVICSPEDVSYCGGSSDNVSVDDEASADETSLS